MKQAIVDKNAAVSSAALVSSLHLSRYLFIQDWDPPLNRGQEEMNWNVIW